MVKDIRFLALSTPSPLPLLPSSTCPILIPLHSLTSSPFSFLASLSLYLFLPIYFFPLSVHPLSFPFLLSVRFLHIHAYHHHHHHFSIRLLIHLRGESNYARSRSASARLPPPLEPRSAHRHPSASLRPLLRPDPLLEDARQG